MAEIEFGQIAVKVLLAAMLIDAFHSALEHGIEAFRAIDADADTAQAIGVGVFLAGMINHAVFVKQLVKAAVGIGLVGHDMRFFGNIRLHNRNDVLFLG